MCSVCRLTSVFHGTVIFKKTQQKSLDEKFTARVFAARVRDDPDGEMILERKFVAKRLRNCRMQK